MTSTVMDIDQIRAAVQRGRKVDSSWTVGVAVVCPLALFVAVWESSGFGGGPARFLVLIGGVAALAVVLTTAVVMTRTSIRFRAAAAGLATVTIVAVCSWSLSGGLTSFKLRADVGSWQQTVQHLTDSSGSRECSRPISSTMAGLGRVSQVCPFSDGFLFLGSPPGTNLVYSKGAVDSGDDCVVHVSGSWWETIAAPSDLDNGGDCPAGFHFVAGP